MSDREAESVIQRAATTARANAQRVANQASTLAVPARAAYAGYRVVDAETIAEQERRADANARREAVAACRARANVPGRFLDAKIDDWSLVPDDAVERYAAAARRLSGGLKARGLYVLCGEIGDGKSHMACGLVNAFCDAGRSARYTKTKDFIDALRGTWGDAQATARFKREHERFALLVLDEWQARNNTDSEELELFKLIDMRYDAGGTTVVISNHANAEEVGASLDARVVDRMCDGGGVIVCAWPSIRGRLKARAGALNGND